MWQFAAREVDTKTPFATASMLTHLDIEISKYAKTRKSTLNPVWLYKVYVVSDVPAEQAELDEVEKDGNYEKVVATALQRVKIPTLHLLLLGKLCVGSRAKVEAEIGRRMREGIQ